MKNETQKMNPIREHLPKVVLAGMLLFAGKAVYNYKTDTCVDFTGTYDPTPSDLLNDDQFVVEGRECYRQGEEIPIEACPQSSSKLNGVVGAVPIIQPGTLVEGTCQTEVQP